MSDLTNSCKRCGLKRSVNHARTTPLCKSCSQVPDLPWGRWMESAACANDAYDPEWWWPTSVESETATLAKNICRYCPVRQICLDYAIQHGLNEGIWGGLMPSQRQTVRKVRRAG